MQRKNLKAARAKGMATYKAAPTGPSADFQQKPSRPGGRRMTFVKYPEIKLVTQEYSVQQSYYSAIIQLLSSRVIIPPPDMAGKSLPKQEKAERVDEP